MYLFMRWSVRYGQMTRQKRSSRKTKTPKFITLQVLGAVSIACHVGPDGEKPPSGQKAEDRKEQRKSLGHNLDCKEKASQGRVNSSGLASLKTASVL